MLRHLILALFLLALSLPAVATPAHAETAPAAAHCHGSADSDSRSHPQKDADTGKAGHICIGCAAKGAPLLIIAPVASPARAPTPQPLAKLAGADLPPRTPPPRA